MTDNYVSPAALFDILCVAANAQTPEEKARVGWRASDHMWRGLGAGVGLPYARAFNNMMQDMNLPWVTDLWTKDEVRGYYKAQGMTDEQIKTVLPALG
jgi:hypothetical protein